MDRQGLWDTVARARASVEDTYGDTEEFAAALTDVLAELEPAEIAAFDHEFQRLYADSYRVDLWAAAYLICGGASDDAFDYFRGWLIAQGQSAWDAALADPDTLTDLLDPATDADFDGDLVMYAAADAYERVAGATLPPIAGPEVPAGEAFDFEDEAELRIRLPRLSARIESLEADPEDAIDEDQVEDDERADGSAAADDVVPTRGGRD
ncbi:DUF4240 domain-containing protein [Kribbella sp. NPDC020789]